MGNHKDLGPPGHHLTVLTQKVWARENLGMTMVRRGEMWLSAWGSQREGVKEELDTYRSLAKDRDAILGMGEKGNDAVSRKSGGSEVIWEGHSQRKG